jgi:FtsZ-interacting cell division protein YlmF
LTELVEWGPTLVGLLAVAAAFVAVVKATEKPMRRSQNSRFDGGTDSSSLRAAFRSAEAINAYDVASFNDPRIHFQEVVRLVSTAFQDGAVEISQHFRDNSVVSVDLSRMNPRQAARLVDFCSGMLAGTSGWLFRATDQVVILTPRSY